MIFVNGSRLEEIGRMCFYSSGLEETTLPKTLKKIGDDTFSGCEHLKKIYVENGCEANLVHT